MNKPIATSPQQTTDGSPCGYIESTGLTELWFHTGTACNLSCPFCLEGSGPGDKRIQLLKLSEVEPFINEALKMGVKQFSFTGGEPFVNKDMIRILELALKHRPALVLSNGTKPLRGRMNDILALRDKPNKLTFRISIDFPTAVQHDSSRGEGSFELAMQTLVDLNSANIGIAVARHAEYGEDTGKVTSQFVDLFRSRNLPVDIPITSFPDLHPPGTSPSVPEITENCMTTYKTADERAKFMCSFSRMIVKKNDRVGIYACTLVDDDPRYDLGTSLKESISTKVMLRHHRCFACFSAGTSCSSLG